jgi:hypothetical protein
MQLISDPNCKVESAACRAMLRRSSNRTARFRLPMDDGRP